ncbi:hypothetical protein [Sphingomonas asaccharolytica]|uniref:hypothetical protein n=1 Tax=Sphingomonas asaccharolytica TaxID=40681 RepID=UPI00082FE6E3|nr:hypothetical protein [Sphingomonas asaccharolytica]
MIATSSATPLGSDVADQIAHRYRLADRMRRALKMLDRDDVGHLLRSHLDETIEWNEIKKRENLDELLAGLSLLHIAGLDRRDDLAGVGLRLSDVLKLLDHPSVARYFEDTYPFAPPVLLRESFENPACNSYLEHLAEERAAEGWLTAFRQFLNLDAAFNASDPLELFLGLLDSYVIYGFDLDDLKRALCDEERMRRLLSRKRGRRVLEGLQDFFEFSEDLDEALAHWDRFPLFAGLVWLHYGYWYGAGGQRMRDVASWLESTIEQIVKRDGGQEALARDAQLHATMGRLTALGGYPKLVLRECALPLERWRLHVERSRGNSRVVDRRE